MGGRVDLGGVEGGVEPVEGDMEDPDPVEVDEQMCGGTLLKVCLEEDFVPVDASEARVSFGRRYINQAGLDVR